MLQQIAIYLTSQSWWYMDPKLYLPSKQLHHNAKMMTGINRLKTWIIPTFSTVAHLGPHVSNLKAAFVFLWSTFSRLLYDITARRLRAGASSPCVGSNSTIIHFLHYLFIITQPNKCAVCSVMLHHTSDKVTRVSASPTTKVTLSSSHFHLLLPREGEYFSSSVSWKYSVTK